VHEERRIKNKGFMTQIKSSYSGQLRTQVIHQPSGNQLITDAPKDNHGKGEAFSPTDLVAAALASCMMTIIGIEANKKSLDIGNLEALTEKVMKSDPRTIERLKVTLSFQNHALSSADQEYLKEKALSCPVALSLHPELQQAISFNF
jgi:uncharacterized OsmC-like protein